MKRALYIIFILISFNGFSQEAKEIMEVSVFNINECDEKPKFADEDGNWEEWITSFCNKINRDSICHLASVYFVITIDTLGKTSEPQIIFHSSKETSECKVSSKYIDQLKKDFVEQMPLWEPCIINGQKQICRIRLPIKFEF